MAGISSRHRGAIEPGTLLPQSSGPERAPLAQPGVGHSSCGSVLSWRQTRVFRTKALPREGLRLHHYRDLCVVFGDDGFCIRDCPKTAGTAGVPQVGQKTPDFTLANTNGQQISLAQLLSTPVGNAHPKAVLLVFYRGYW